ncbi:MAG: leucine-rich repeat domain-containing protein [Lachnospiraceae bacterium]|nr:leucine-rich repeat domain-containing protein [Lachnospiraceae bacterium]
MRITWEYQRLSEGIRILRAWGEAECLTVPEILEGLPVTEIGPYAFSTAELPRRLKEKEGERRRTVEEGTNLIEEPGNPVAGNRLQAIRLPASVQVIGDYAFYGCLELKEIAFADSMKRIGSGAFMGCRNVDRLELEERGTGENTLYQMLSELRYTIEVIIRRSEGSTVLILPEYYESSVENIPARILELHYQGTGYRYRQCFRNGIIDYREYDRLFGLAESQEPPEVLTRLAYNRIQYPEGLSEEAKGTYLEWIGANVREAGNYFLKRDDLPAIRLLCEAGGFNGTAKDKKKEPGTGEGKRVVADGAGDFYMASMGEHILGEAELEPGEGKKSSGEEESSRASLDILLEMAGHMGRTEIVSYLMDYRYRKQGGRKKKVFDL